MISEVSSTHHGWAPTTFASVSCTAASHVGEDFRDISQLKEAELVGASKISSHWTHTEISCQQSPKLSVVRYLNTLKKPGASWWPVGQTKLLGDFTAEELEGAWGDALECLLATQAGDVGAGRGREVLGRACSCMAKVSVPLTQWLGQGGKAAWASLLGWTGWGVVLLVAGRVPGEILSSPNLCLEQPDDCGSAFPLYFQVHPATEDH